jgi:hypothetical protein
LWSTSLPDGQAGAIPPVFSDRARDNGANARAGDVMAFRLSAKWLTGRPALATVLVATVGTAAGVGIGFKVEQGRTRSDVNRLKARISQLTAVPHTKPVVKRSAVSSTRAGTVTAISSGGFGVSTKKHRTFQVSTTKSTKFEQANRGSKADIVVGRRVFVSISRTDVIVLPRDSLLGRLVTRVSSGSFSIKRANGKGATSVSFSTVKAIDAVSSAQPSALKKGSALLTSVRAGSKGTSDAVEVILLPTGSDFAS